jgi:hypothetical protein
VRLPHELICPEGHRCHPRPSHVREGRWPCRTCTGNDPRQGEAAFKGRLAELDATPAWDKWRGRKEKHKVICRNGHECWPRPDRVNVGGGICRPCVYVDRMERSEAEFREALAKIGATPAWDGWRGANAVHDVICRAGHKCRVSATKVVKMGRGICITCAMKDTAAAEASYRERLADLGATPAWTEWRGTQTPHKVICPAGHECEPTPTSVQRGKGACRFCAGKAWDVFYVVANDERRTVKFGITSGDPRARLADHRRHGYRRVVLLAETVLAHAVEAETISALRQAGRRAVHGREYFPGDALDAIVQIAMSYGLEADFKAADWPAPPGLAAA